MKSTPEGLKSWCEQAIERVYEVKDRRIERTKSEEEKEKGMKKSK